MSPKSLPAAITVITVLALSLPLASALAEAPGTRSRNHPLPSAQVQDGFWQRVLDFLVPAAGPGQKRKPMVGIAGKAGCEMDPDGRVRTVSAPAPGAGAGADRH